VKLIHAWLKAVKLLKSFESVEMAEYEYMVSASYSDPYWVRVKQAILDCGAMNE